MATIEEARNERIKARMGMRIAEAEWRAAELEVEVEYYAALYQESERQLQEARDQNQSLQGRISTLQEEVENLSNSVVDEEPEPPKRSAKKATPRKR